MIWAATAFVVVVLVCGTAVFRDVLRYDFLETRRKHMNTTHLAEHLEAKLSDMEDLKVKLNLVLIKNGLGR